MVIAIYTEDIAYTVIQYYWIRSYTHIKVVIVKLL